MTQNDGTGQGGAFSGRVLVLFATQVVTAGMGIFNGFLLARVLGPSAKGDYYLLTLLPVTIMVLIQFGLPQSFNFFSARGKTGRISSKTVYLTVILAVPALLVTIAILPALQATVMQGPDAGMIIFALLALPLLLNATFTTGVVIGREVVRWASAVYIFVAFSTTLLLIVLVVVLGQGLVGALLAFFFTALIQATGFLIASVRVTGSQTGADQVSTRELFGFGLSLYPGNLARYLAYRADVYLLAWLLADPSAPLGYYSMGVSMAELVIFLPRAVSTFFFPHVAKSSREDADRQVPAVTRVTLLLTAGVAIAMVPVAIVLITVLIPAFTPALTALYILLPGVVALSISEVLGGYVSGLGMTTTSSMVYVAAFIVNVVMNLVLIPPYGILGAATASLVSYTFAALVFGLIASRLARTPLREFLLPGRSDIRFIVVTLVSLGRRATGKGLDRL